MKKEELEKLAKKVQLEIKEEETIKYLKGFKQLEKPLINFKKAKINPRIKPMVRIDIGHLTLAELKKSFSSPLISKKSLKNNSIAVTKDNLVLFKKIS